MLSYDRSYADHQEGAASALNQLINAAQTLPTPHDPHDVDQLLACRGATIDALLERLEHLGHNGYDKHASRTSDTDLLSIALSRDPVTVLHHLADHLPRRPETQDVDVSGPSPVEALGTVSTNTLVELWRTVGVDLLAANHALSNAPEQPWLTEPGAAWHLVGDTAAALEAVVVADTALAAAGLLDDHHRAAPDPASNTRRKPRNLGVAEQRMVTSQVARSAGWYTTTSAADQAVAPTAQPRPTGPTPVHLVSVPADLITAQRHLAAHLAPVRPDRAATSAYQVMDAVTARTVTRSQSLLNHQLAQLCSTHPALAAAGAHFTTQARQLDDLDDKLRHLTDLTVYSPRRTNGTAIAQQTEISTAMRRFGGAPELSRRQVGELLNTTHDVMHNLAVTTRAEIHRDATKMREIHQFSEVGPTRVWRHHPLSQTLTAIANTPAPMPAVMAYAHPAHRLALRETLNNTPTASSSHSPYPPGHNRRQGPTPGL